jgi:hypothetical protein
MSWAESLKGAAAVACVAAAALPPPQDRDPAERHHRLGIEHHLSRRLDDASREYARSLELEPSRALTSGELELVRRFAPRLYTTPREFFALKDFAIIVHPRRRLIAYHFFWEDDIDFPEDNDPCDHELMWVQYSQDTRAIEQIWTYFHGRLLRGTEAALADARQHAMRPRVSVQWGKHGSMPADWENLAIAATEGDIERKYLPVDRQITLKQYNEATFKKLNTDGRRLMEHPLARRLGWPQRFTGTWADFVAFSREVDVMAFLDRTQMVRVSRWNSATIDQHFLPYNFRPKTEWPE